jgi:hypothetical protein
MNSQFQSYYLKGRDHLKDQGVDGDKIKTDCKETVRCRLSSCETG